MSLLTKIPATFSLTIHRANCDETAESGQFTVNKSTSSEKIIDDELNPANPLWDPTELRQETIRRRSRAIKRGAYEGKILTAKKL
jgi:hypothetical protein